MNFLKKIFVGLFWLILTLNLTNANQNQPIILFDDVNNVENNNEEDLKERLSNMAYVSFLSIQSDFTTKKEQGEFITYLFTRLDNIYWPDNQSVQLFKMALLRYYIIHHYPDLIANL